MENLSFGDSKKTFAEKVISILSTKNIKYTTLANGVGENESNIKNSLYGRKRINKELAHKICDYLDVDYDEMTKEDEYFKNLNKPGYTFGEKLEKILLSKNIYKSQLAEDVGISKATVTNIITDKTDLKKDVLVKICNRLNLDIYDMIKDDPKYANIKQNLENKVSISSIFLKLGINNPVPDANNILMELINNNREKFIQTPTDNIEINSYNIENNKQEKT